MTKADGGGPSFFDELNTSYVGAVQAGLAGLAESNGFEFRRHAALEQLDAPLAEARTAWSGLCNVLRDSSGAAQLRGRRLHLVGQSQLALANGRPIDPLEDQPTAELTTVPLDVSVTLHPEPRRGFAPQQERAAAWALRKGRARAALTTAILDNLGMVDLDVSAPLRSRGVPLGDYHRRFTFRQPTPPFNLSDAGQFRHRYDWASSGAPDESLIKSDAEYWLTDTNRTTALMIGSASFLASVKWQKPA
jgi:hypothetical protein